MPSQRLLTLLHVSDLHIGPVDPGSGNSAVAPLFTRLFSNFTWFDGLLGHHARGLVDLRAFYRHLQPERPLLLVTGDLTRAGDGSEFDNADDFLVSQLDLNPPHGNFVGLHHRGWLNYAIPGNHDHWPGTPTIWGGPHPALHVYCPQRSFVRPPINLGNSRILQIAGIDTDADVGARSLSRARGLGRFQSELPALELQLGPKRPEHVRILLMHHSWFHQGRTLALDGASRAALAQFLVNNGIQVVLTGHIHTSYLGAFQPQPGQPHTVWECRCGTTAQADQVPYTWRTPGGAFPQRNWPANALLVHRLRAENGQTFWDVETFVRSRAGGFVSTGPGGQRSFEV
jgi:3',5'-cyclic AMP phosphodiesterase CpdA